MKDQAFGIIPIWQQEDCLSFLLVQHRAGHWGFPKGHAEAGETAIATACRELREETGIRDCQVLDVSFVERYFFTQRQQSIEKTVLYFPAFVQSIQVTPQAAEIKNYCWLPYDRALEQLTFPQGRHVLTQVYQYLQNLQTRSALPLPPTEPML